MNCQAFFFLAIFPFICNFTPLFAFSSVYIRHTSSCRCVDCARSPQLRTYVRSRGFTPLPPSCNLNYLGYSCAFRLTSQQGSGFHVLRAVNHSGTPYCGLPHSASTQSRIKTYQSAVELDRLPYSLFYGDQSGVSG